jgi:hypothetical protein
METKINQPPDLDEVERCRQVRRLLEKVHGGLKGLCDRIETLDRKRLESILRTSKRRGRAKPKRRTG